MSATSEDSRSKETSSSGTEFTPREDTPASERELVNETEKLVIVPEKDVGMTPDLKHLYGSKEDKRGRFTWYGPVHPVLHAPLHTDRLPGTPNYPKTLESPPRMLTPSNMPSSFATFVSTMTRAVSCRSTRLSYSLRC